MLFESQLYKAKLIKRYKRFLADVEILSGPDKGQFVTAHCANPGAMTGLKDEGAIIWLSHHDNPKRKLKYSWELVEISTGELVEVSTGELAEVSTPTKTTPTKTLVGVNTNLPNKIAYEAISKKMIPELTRYDEIKTEVKYGQNSRIDIFLKLANAPDIYVEVKSVTLAGAGTLFNDQLPMTHMAAFPDSETKRGQKHLDELVDMVRAGHRAVMLYLIQRDDCKGFTVADDIDPIYGEKLRLAQQLGVEIYAWDCQVTHDEIALRRQVEIFL